MTNRATQYSAGIMSESSWFLEFKKLVQLKESGATDEEIKKTCIEENLFGMTTENRIRRSAGYLLSRIGTMDGQLIKIFCVSDLATQKIINFITILRGDRLFYEFVNEVYREKTILGFDTIEKSDVNAFFRGKAEGSEAFSTWKDTTYRKVRCCYLNFMADANLLSKDRSTYHITPPVLDSSIERYLIGNGEAHMLKAITGVR